MVFCCILFSIESFEAKILAYTWPRASRPAEDNATRLRYRPTGLDFGFQNPNLGQ